MDAGNRRDRTEPSGAADAPAGGGSGRDGAAESQRPHAVGGPDEHPVSYTHLRESGLFRRLFEQVLLQCMNKGLITGHTILTDSTHIKANASSRKNIKVMVEKEAGSYLERLDAYEEQERSRLEEMGMIKPQRKRRRPEGKVMVEKTVSTTDPDAGMMHRPGKPEGMHYLSHQSIDAANGMIVDVAVTLGDVSDSVPYLERIDYMRNHLGLDIRTAGADSAYGTSLICQTMEDMGVTFYTPGVSGGIEKSCLMYQSYYGYDNDISVACCGSSISSYHIDLLKSCLLYTSRCV